MSIKLVIPSNHLILCCPLLLLPSVFPSIRVFSWVSFSHHMAKVLGVSASTSVLPMNIQDCFFFFFFKIALFDFIAVQGTRRSLLRYYSSKTPILQRSALFIVQLSHPYMTTGKTTALTRWTFVSKVMSLLFNMLSRFIIAFLPRGKCLLISWLQSPSAVILEPQKIVCHC